MGRAIQSFSNEQQEPDLTECEKNERLKEIWLLSNKEALEALEVAAEAGEIMRGLIERIVLTPESEGLKAELFRDLAVLSGFAIAGARRGRT